MAHKALKYRFIVILALMAIVASALTTCFYLGATHNNASLNMARTIVGQFQSGSTVTLPEIRSAMPASPEVDLLVEGRVECSYYLGSHGLFGGAWLIIYADPVTEVVLECYILYD